MSHKQVEIVKLVAYAFVSAVHCGGQLLDIADG